MLPTSQAAFFHELMQYLWGDDEPEHRFITRAVGDRIRGTKGCNPENALDVLNRVSFTKPTQWYVRGTEQPEEGHISLWHVTFQDKSQVIIEAPHGIGSSVELVRG